MPRASAPPRYETAADLLERLGRINPRRVRVNPPPGQATERDLIRLNDHTNRLYELVDGVLVEKVMGYPESMLALWIGYLLQSYLQEHDLGFLAGADGGMRLMPGLVRIPDLSFISWDRVPVRGQVPSDPIAALGPDLAVEVLSKGNTPREMARKLKEYFLAGARLVWFVDPRPRTIQVFTAPDQSYVLTEEQTLDGGDVLPGLALPLREIFTRIPPQTEGVGKKPGTSRKRTSGKPRRGS